MPRFWVADALAALLEALGGIDQQHVVAVLRRLGLAEQPDIGGNARVVERVARQLDDRVKPIVFQHLAADAVLAADERARLGDAVGERVELLPVTRHARVGIHLAQALLGAAEHLGRCPWSGRRRSW